MEDRVLVIVGGGGHARVAAEVIEACGRYHVLGYTSIMDDDGIPGYTRLGDDGVLADLYAEHKRIAFVAIGDNALRAEIYQRIVQMGFEVPSFVHPWAVVSARARIGKGTIVMPGAVVNTGTLIGEAAIVNTSASVDHDCRIGDFVHIAPGCRLAGTVSVGEGAFLGIGSSVIPTRTIGAWSTLGAGAAVTADIGDGVVALGVPARVRTGSAGGQA